MKYTVAFLAAIAAVNGSPMPMPQGVTSAIAPSGVAPSGCMPSYSGSFGIAVMNVTAGGVMSATQLPDGQPQATSAPVSQISDGQPQASTGAPAPAPPPVSQISDGQPQASTGMMSVPAVSQISDGQIQATPKPTMMSVPAVSQISDGQIQATPKQTMAPVSQISDGQIQATKSAPAVSQISDGQIQATKSAAPAVSQISDGQIQATTAPAVSQISDGQPQATGVSQISDGQPQATAAPGAPAPQMVACATDSTLTLTLEGGILKDNKGRTGYIASNYQFQFDNPPQAGAIYTAGWSVCANGSLTLGGDSIFYQCLSGNFYNLYNKNWAAQCNAVTIDVLELMNCPSS